MSKKAIVLFMLLLAIITPVFAGDVARFVNLGFSPDSNYYMFGYYGMEPDVGKPYSEIFIVDTKKNNFVPNGIFKGLYAVNLEPGWDASGSFYKLFSDSISLARKYKIDHLQQGRLVYLLINGTAPSDKLTFQDFDNGSKWDVELKKTIKQEPEQRSSFEIIISITSKDNKKTVIKAGNPKINRKNVSDYTIRQIIVAPNGKTAVAIIEKIEKTKTESNIRYMVETFSLEN